MGSSALPPPSRRGVSPLQGAIPKNSIAPPSRTALAGRISPPPRPPPPPDPDSPLSPRPSIRQHAPPPPALWPTMADRLSHPSKKKAGTPRMASPLFTIINSPSFTSHFFLGGRLSLPGPEGFPVVLGKFMPDFGPFCFPIATSPPQNQRPSPLHPRSGPRCSRRLPASRLPPAVGPAAPHCRTSPAKPAPTRCSNDR